VELLTLLRVRVGGWWIMIQSVMFNECSRLAHHGRGAEFSEVLDSYRANQFATKSLLDSFADYPVRDEVVNGFTKPCDLCG
jgi:hypothetical protein